MPYIDQYNNSQDTDFKKRVHIALITAAVDIAGEVKPVGTPPVGLIKWQKRAELAKSVLSNNSVGQWALLVAADPTITLASTDAAILARVSAVFDDVAGCQDGDQL